MLGLVFIYFIGKYFFQLADTYDKHKWGYSVLGVASYYVGTFIGGIVMYLVLDMSGVNVDEMNERLFSFTSIPFGIIACVGVYKLFERQWKSPRGSASDDLLDGEMY